MRVLDFSLRAGAILLGVVSLSACLGGGDKCERLEPYQESRTGGALQVPEGLSRPSGSQAMNVPDIADDIAVRGPCGDVPPKAVVVPSEPERPPVAVAATPASVPERSAPQRAAPAQDLPPIVIPSITGVANVDITATIQAWLESWRRGDIETFLSFYDPQFASPVAGESREQWEEKRRLLFSDTGFADIRFDLLQITELEGGAEARFMQEFYLGDGQINAVMKRLRLVPRGFRWLIPSEEVEMAL